MSKLNVALLLTKNDWSAIDAMDNWLWVFDRLPPKMRLTVDFKIQGMSNQEIAIIMRCTVNSVCNQLRKAKKRFLKGENIG